MVYGMGTEEKCSTIVKPELTVMLGHLPRYVLICLKNSMQNEEESINNRIIQSPIGQLIVINSRLTEHVNDMNYHENCYCFFDKYDISYRCKGRCLGGLTP